MYIDNRVIIQKCRENIEQILKEFLKFFISYLPRDNETLIIKPNLCDLKHWTTGATTDPKFIEALINAIRSYTNPRIIIVESDHAICTAEEVFNRLEYEDLAERMDVQLLNLSKDELIRVNLNGDYFSVISAPKTLLQADHIISVACLKTHFQQRITGTIKNLFGLIPRRNKAIYHPFINQVLYDLISLYHPTISIIDGRIGMEGFGPSDGTPRKADLLMMGSNPISTDMAAAITMGVNPLKVPAINYMIKRKLTAFKKPLILGEKLNLNFRFTPPGAYLMQRIGFTLGRISRKTRNMIRSMSELATNAGAAIVVLDYGLITTARYGGITRNLATEYAKGIIKRWEVKVKLKLSGI